MAEVRTNPNNFQSCAYALNDYDFVLPNADLIVDSTVPRQHIEAELDMYDYSYDFKNKSDGEAYVRTRLEELSAQYLQGQGHGEARGLTSGGLFTLTNLPREDQNCEYNVVSVRHSIHIADFFATGRGGGQITQIVLPLLKVARPSGLHALRQNL